MHNGTLSWHGQIHSGAKSLCLAGPRTSSLGTMYKTASTPRRKNKPHSEGHSRSEWLADHGPLERLGEGAVEVGDEGFDARLQVLLRGEAGAAQQLAHEDGEPDLYLVQPGRMLGGEVKADAVAGIAQERLTTGH